MSWRNLMLITGGLAATVLVPAPPAGAATTIGDVTVVGPVTAGEPTTITAVVDDPDPSGVHLDVVIDLGAAQAVEMHDDGESGDGAAGDGVFGAAVASQTADTLVRYRVRSGEAVAPEPDDERRYEGFVVEPREVESAVPVLDWRIDPADYDAMRADPADRTYRPTVLIVDGEVYDGVEVRPQGGATAQTGPKPNFKLKLPSSTPLTAPFFDDPVDSLVMDADFEDPTYSVNVVGNEMYERHGAPQRQVTTARVERNGGFHGIYQLLEEQKSVWRSRAGFEVASHYEGESQATFLVDEGHPDLLEDRFSLEHPEDDGDFVDLHDLAVALDGVPSGHQPDAIFDSFDLPELVDVLAVSALIHNWDTFSGNWTLLRDADTDRWRAVPNDLDLILGLRDDSRTTSLVPNFALGTFSPLFSDDRFVDMYLRRLRTLLDTELTAAAVLGRLDQNVDGLGPEIALDRATWPLETVPPDAGRAGIADFVADRRANLLAYASAGELPAAQAGGAVAVIAEIRSSGDPGGDFVALANPSTTDAVDVSGWSLSGDAASVLPPGSVVPAGGELVVPADPAAMAARAEGVPVAGRLDGELSDGGGGLALHDASGAARDAVTWSVGGGWPATDGRSIEAVTLGDRSGPSAWRASPDVGGTPGAAGPAASPLTVTVETGRASAPAAGSFDAHVVVHNRGEVPLDGVEVTTGPAACRRTVGTLPPGARRAWWCTVSRGPTSRTSQTITVGATASTDGAHDRAGTVVTDVSGIHMPRPRSYAATAAPGGIRLLYADASPLAPDDRAHPFATWRTEAQLWQEGTGTVSERLVGANGTVVTGLPADTPISARVVARSTGGLGTPTPRTPGIVARPTVHWPHPDVPSLVRSLFASVAGRQPSAIEVELWTITITQHGTPPARLAVDWLAEPRWAVDATAVARLYTATLGRAPDAAGLGYWIERGESGTSLASMAGFFARSAEFRAVYGDLDDRQFVDRLYRNVFGRPGEPGGIDYWAGRLRGGLPRGGVVLGFTQSPEGRRLLDAAAEVDVAWYALAGARAPNAARADAVAWRSAGGSMLTIVDSIRTRTPAG